MSRQRSDRQGSGAARGGAMPCEEWHWPSASSRRRCTRNLASLHRTGRRPQASTSTPGAYRFAAAMLSAAVNRAGHRLF
jgi:hypothetical protein